MMKRWAALGLLSGMGLAALVQAPAVWLAHALSAASGARAQLLDMQGTVWRGDARLLLGESANSADARVLPGRVSWRLGWHKWNLQVGLRADCCMAQEGRLRIVPSWGGLSASLADGSSHWPAAMLSAAGAPWNTVQPEGELRVRTQALSVEWIGGRARLNGQVQLDAIAVASRLSTVRPVGSYRATYVGAAGAAPASLQLQTLEGPLRMDGKGQWVGSRLRFSGEASTDPASEAALGNLLNTLGRRQGNKSVLSLG
jgi:general secretion pathway protein N